MKRDTEYIIPYEGLKQGKHEFTFDITDSFFEQYNADRDYKKVAITMKVELMKDITMLQFHFIHQGKLDVDCDTCLAGLSINIEGDNRLFVKFGDVAEDDDENIITLPKGEYEIDLKDFIYDYIMLSLPWKIDCEAYDENKKPCDKEMLAKIEALQVKEKTEEVDPRWANLNKLKSNNN